MYRRKAFGQQTYREFPVGIALPPIGTYPARATSTPHVPLARHARGRMNSRVSATSSLDGLTPSNAPSRVLTECMRFALAPLIHNPCPPCPLRCAAPTEADCLGDQPSFLQASRSAKRGDLRQATSLSNRRLGSQAVVRLSGTALGGQP